MKLIRIIGILLEKLKSLKTTLWTHWKKYLEMQKEPKKHIQLELKNRLMIYTDNKKKISHFSITNILDFFNSELTKTTKFHKRKFHFTNSFFEKFICQINKNSSYQIL